MLELLLLKIQSLMRYRTLLIVFVLLSMTACQRRPMPAASSNEPQFVKMKPVSIARSVNNFTRLQVFGRINVLLKNCAKSAVILKGDPRDLAQVILIPSGQGITIRLGSAFPQFGSVTADICTPYLNAFTYKGGGIIKAPNLRSAALVLSIDNTGSTKINGTLYLRSLKAYGSSNIEINGLTAQSLKIITVDQPHIKLTGVIKLCNLDVSGNGFVTMYWVKSNYLTLRARGSSFVQLAGIANVLDAELWGTAKLSASFLRAKRVFLKTHDRALAQITALDRQHTKATDSSDIYFYKIPEMRTDFMAYNGAVLDMREMDAYMRRDYDRYNK